MQLFYSILRLLIPSKCVVCGKEDETLCFACAQKMFVCSPICCFCEQMSLFNRTHPSCRERDYIPHFCIYPFAYRASIKRILREYKYRGYHSLKELLYELIYAYARADPFLILKHNLERNQKILLLPVPMHHSKLAARGFSPALQIAEIYAKVISNLFGVNCLVNNRILKKDRATEAQAKKKRYDRLLGQMNVFSVDDVQLQKTMESFNPDTVMVIDDVVSTGATVYAVLEVLHKAMAIKNIVPQQLSVASFAKA